MSRRIVVLGDCQAGGISASLALMLPQDTIRAERWSRHAVDAQRIISALRDADLVVSSMPSEIENRLRAAHDVPDVPLLRFPRFQFRGFHPDIIIARVGGEAVRIRGGAAYHSAIAAWCWRQGLNSDQTRALFTARTFERLGYMRAWSAETARVRDRFRDSDLAFADIFLPLQVSGQVFMHTFNHPCIRVLVEIARGIARRLGAPEEMIVQPLERLLPDTFSGGTIWPVYPGVADHLGVRAATTWRIGQATLSLDDFLRLQFRALDRAGTDVDLDVADTPAFDLAMRGAFDALAPVADDEDPWRRTSSRLGHPSI